MMRWNTWGRVAVLVIISGALATSRGWGQPTDDAAELAVPSTGATISMDLVDASLDDVLKLLSQQSGVNFVAAQAVRERRVTVYMDRVPMRSAIQSLLTANNFALAQPDAGNVFVVTESGDRPIRLITRVYTLKFARVLPTVGEVVQSFGTTGSLVQTALGGTGTGGSESGGGSSGGGGGGGGGLAALSGAGEAAQGIIPIIKQLLTERGAVTIDPRTNSLAVTDIPAVFPAIEEALVKLDVKPAQVYLEAEVLEVSVNTLRRLGVEYGTSTGTIASYVGPVRKSTFPLTHGLIDGTKSAGTMGTLSVLADPGIVLKALSTEKDVKYLARPRLMTLSNEVAEIQIITETATGTVTTSQATTGTTTSEPERRTVGTILRVTPLVTDNRYVTMVIEPEVSRVSASTTFSSVLDPSRRAARTTIMVESGQTAMIAGLLSGEWEKSSRKVPILGDIPILGIPFQRKERSRVDTEIIIFITPRIMADPTTPAIATAPIPGREQTPLSTNEQTAYRRHREEMIRRQRIHDTLELLQP